MVSILLFVSCSFPSFWTRKCFIHLIAVYPCALLPGDYFLPVCPVQTGFRGEIGGSLGRDGLLRCKMSNLFRLVYCFPYQIPRFWGRSQANRGSKREQNEQLLAVSIIPQFVCLGWDDTFVFYTQQPHRYVTCRSMPAHPLSHFLSSGDRQGLRTRTILNDIFQLDNYISLFHAFLLSFIPCCCHGLAQ